MSWKRQLNTSTDTVWKWVKVREIKFKDIIYNKIKTNI